ncbi:hypothetical protein M3O40_20485 [Xanthomonas nasturtii]|nr:hypothetical protein [Xanthomonas nasturtii]MCL1501503.1 hypothetical protein [Xanthomonas nasturtii]MCL1505417.1 hypothetical protein [Xanthomonas nasturtii]
MPIYMVSFECKSSDKDYTGFFSKINLISPIAQPAVAGFATSQLDNDPT